jgi:hypothetical protein
MNNSTDVFSSSDSESPESEEEEDTYSESLRWMLGARQKNEELDKLKGEIESTEAHVVLLQTHNAQLRDMLERIPEREGATNEGIFGTMPTSIIKIEPPPPPPVRADAKPTTITTTKNRTTRVFAESLALAHKQLAVQSSPAATDLEPVWRTFADHLESVPPLALRNADGDFDDRCVTALQGVLESLI